MRAPRLLRDSPVLRGADLERAARLLLVRSRRESRGAFVGGYRSAFRGGGVEFEESRPYAPGDDVRAIDWNALARTGVPYVKRFREERDQTVILAVDVSGSMGFGSVGPGKAASSARAAALVAAAAAGAGDRVGLVTFDTAVREEIPLGRGDGHVFRLLRALVAAAGESGGGTGLEAALARVRASAPRRAIVFLVSDFRDDAFFAPSAPGAPSPRAGLVALARLHDLVAVVVHDPREDELPRAGAGGGGGPAAPGRPCGLHSGSARARRRYRAACEVRRRALVRRLRTDGVDVLLLRSDRDPLRALARFFEGHAAVRAAAGGRRR